MKAIVLTFLMIGGLSTAFAGSTAMGGSTLVFETGHGLKLEMTVNQDKEIALESVCNQTSQPCQITKQKPDFALLWPVIQSMLKPEPEEELPFQLN